VPISTSLAVAADSLCVQATPSGAPKLAIYHEHPDWFRPLFAELKRRAIPFERINARELFYYDPAQKERDFSVLFNRMSPSAYLRDGGSAIMHALNFLAHLERIETRVINGARAFTFEVSKALQLTLLAKLGLPAPRSRVIHRGVDAAIAADGLRFPVVVKANVGGSGAGIVRYDSREELAQAARENQIDLGLDRVALVQEYVPARDGFITRVETLRSLPGRCLPNARWRRACAQRQLGMPDRWAEAWFARGGCYSSA
jgi:glutathione synthase/RimK-type ligase-like ATP-grasp enzyme